MKALNKKNVYVIFFFKSAIIKLNVSKLNLKLRK